MYICIHVYIYTYMYVCMYVCMYVRMYVCMYVSTRASIIPWSTHLHIQFVESTCVKSLFEQIKTKSNLKQETRYSQAYK